MLSKLNAKRGQVSTEYLVIIGVVLVIALVVVFLLTRSTNLAGGAVDSQSKNYWSSQAPFSVSNYRASDTSLDLVMKNNDADQLTLTGVSGTGITAWSGSTLFEANQERTLTVTLTATCGTAGTRFQYANVTMTYTKGSLASITQVGTVPLSGTCS